MKITIEKQDFISALAELEAAGDLLNHVTPHAGDAFANEAKRLSVKYLCNTVLTNAPDDYDYGYCIPLVPDATPPEGLEGKGRFRTVAVPKDKTSYQCARYSSGLYYREVIA